MNSIQKLTLVVGAAVASLVIASTAVADPLPGRDRIKFSQKPMDGTTFTNPNGTVQHIVYGHDELSTAYSQNTFSGVSPYRGTFMADDFADKINSPVVHVKWWGSYLDNFQSAATPVNKFLIAFESDLPAGPNSPFSRPDQVLSQQIVTKGALAPGSGTYTETLISPGGPPLNEQLYEYNAELQLGHEFFEKADTVYWLKIVALVDVPPTINLPNPNNPPASVTRWGWHNRDYTIQDTLASTAPAVVPGEAIVGMIGPGANPTPVWHFQDDAVTGQMVAPVALTPAGPIITQITQFNYQPTTYRGGGIDGPPGSGIAQFSKDLAFEIYTVVPEPGTCLLMLCGGIGIAVGARRRTDN
jgi:hypothetical protein